MITAQAIKSRHSDVFTYLHGNLDSSAEHCRVPADSCSASLVFVSDAQQIAQAFARQPAILICLSTMSESLKPATDDICCFSVKVMPVGMATLLKYFDRKRVRFTQWGQQHPTAVVHPDARVGSDVYLGPYCVIGANADDRKRLHDRRARGHRKRRPDRRTHGDSSACFRRRRVPDRRRLRGSSAYQHRQRRLRLRPGPDGRPRKIPHLGNVVIGDGWKSAATARSTARR